MKTTKRNTRSAGRRGFTLVEALAVSALMALLAIVIARTWSGLVRPTVDIAKHCRLFHEANLAVMALARDLGGSLANPEGRIGAKAKYRLVGRTQPGNTQLWLCFDGGDNPNGMADWGAPDTVIIYELQADQLVRWDQTANTTFTVARLLDNFEVLDLGDRVQINFTFKYRDVTKVYTFVARNPS
jgi:prepilin-type N-terminal cleavage/methylation domain-containing protein